MEESTARTHHYRWMIPILLLAFALRIACLDAQSLWWDEAFSVTVGSMDLRSLMTTVLDDRVHPPLHYLVLHFWLPLARSEFMVRAPSAFLGALAVASMFPMAALVGGKRLGLISAFALAISPLHIWYSQEARMYSLIVLLTLLANYFFGRLLRRDQPINWLGYSIFTLLAMHAHYLTLFVILAQGTYLILARPRNRVLLREWLLCMLIVGVLCAPWLVAIFLTGGFYQANISWIRPAVPQDLFWTVYDFGLGFSSNPANLFNILAALSIAAILVYVSVRLFRGMIPVRQRNMLRFVWYWLSLPLILVFLISLDWPLPQKRSIYMDRFLIPLLPAFLILVSYGMKRIFERKKALGALAAAVLLVPIGVSTSSLFLDQTYHRDDWRQAIAEIRENAQSGDVLLVRPHHYVPLYYYDLQEIPWFTVPYLESALDYETFLDAQLSTSPSEGGRLWTMIVCENGDPHRFAQGGQQRLMAKVEEDEVRAWLLRNRHNVEDRVYNGVHLSLYDTE
jgi:mannosyltransferase